MVLYFSATGNTEYIAQELARCLEDECINLLDRIKQNDHSVLYSEKPLSSAHRCMYVKCPGF